jgi:hypothetical protein
MATTPVGALTVSYNTMVVGGQFAATVLCGLFSTVHEGWRYMLGRKTSFQTGLYAL